MEYIPLICPTTRDISTAICYALSFSHFVIIECRKLCFKRLHDSKQYSAYTLSRQHNISNYR
ncbi:hypothetical protein BC829DRAFT_394786 [Chytridium lagenaria]|nr:hypothetical protein BC829DRAFT_394786 [Chytridium lagenaria]